MSTTRKVAHNTIAQMAGKIVSTLLGLAAIALMTRYLGQEQFGWYVTVMAFLQFIAIMIDFGLIPVTAQMMSEPRFDKSRLFKNLLAFRFVTAVFFLGLAPCIAWFFPWNNDIKIAISFTTLSMLAVAMNQVLLGFYQTKLKMHIQAIGEVLGRVVLVGGLLLVIVKGLPFLWVMGVVVAGNVAYSLFLWLTANRYSPAGFAFDKDVWKAICIKMWPIAISIIFNVIYLKGDTLLLSLFASQAEVGIYGAAYRVIDILAQIAMMLMGVMLPLMAFNWSRNIKEQFHTRYQQSFDAMMMLAIPIVAGTIAVADDIMIFVAGEQFAEAGIALKILSIGVFGLYLGAVFGHTAVAIDKQKQTMWIYISNAVVTLIGYLIFIPRFGMLGAAWMTVFSELYAGVLLWVTIRYFTKVKLRLQTTAKLIMSAILMVGAIQLMPPIHVMLTVTVGALTYGVSALALGAVSKATLREIFSRSNAGITQQPN